MGKRTIIVLAILALIAAAVQMTPLRFLSNDAGDFVWGLAGGLSIGAIVVLIAGRSGD